MKTRRCRLAGLAGMGWLLVATASADVPGVINYQGRLVTASNLVNGTVSLVLRLYDAETGGTLRYADSNRVTVVDGLYSTWLGDNTIAGTLTNALIQPQVWVELVVNGSSLVPRERLGSVPYALNATVAAGLSTVSPTFAGVVTAAGFAGNGSGLSALESTHLTGPLTVTPTLVNVGHIDDGGYAEGVAVAGDYAYLANNFGGLRIYNVSNPANPVSVGHVYNGGSARGVGVAGNYAYLANDADGLRIYNVSTPATPVNVGHIHSRGFVALDVAVAGNCAYLANFDDGLLIHNVSNPATPFNIGHIDDGGLARGVAVAGNYAYLANDNDGLRIYNVSTPAAPVNVGHIDDGGYAGGVAVAGGYAYLANGDDGLRIYDVSNPANPVNIGHVDDGGSARGVAVAGNYVYLANHSDGLRIYDVSNPVNPVSVGHIDDGGWALCVAVSRNYVYLANYDDGLRIYTIEFAASVAGTVAATGFAGNGGGLTNLNGAVIASGTLPDARLSANVAKLNAAQTFSAQQIFGAGAALNNTDLLLRAGTDGGHGLGWYGIGKTFEGMPIDGPVLYGWWGGILGSKVGGESIALRWDEKDHVGIGTAYPDSPLTVVKKAAGLRGAEVSIVNNSTSAVGNEAALNFGVENSTYAGNDGNAQIKARLMATDNRTDLVFSTYNGGSFGERVRIQAGGNVGIGTATPQRTLHVSDVMRLQPRATAPSPAAEGDMYMDSTTHKLRVYDGTTWQSCW